MPPLPSQRHLRYALRGGTWRHLGRRARLICARERDRGATPLTWPVDAHARESLVIRWPDRYGWPNAGGFADPIKRGIGSHVRIEPAEIRQPAGNVVVLEASNGPVTRSVVIDYSDQAELHECEPQADLYFKMQFSAGGYGSDRVVPGGYVSPKPALYRHARGLRALRDRRPPAHDVVGRFGFRSASALEIRGKAIAMLESQNRFRYTGGGQPVWWGEYLDELCDARVCLDLPGKGELCYRLVDCLAIGACIVEPELEAQLHVPLEPGVHLIRIPRTLDGLIESCERLLADDALRASLSRGAADYFDRYLAVEQLGAYYVDALWRSCRLG